MFAAASVQERRDWVDALQRIAFGQADCSRTLTPSKSITQEHCDDNVLYGSTTDNSEWYQWSISRTSTKCSRLLIAAKRKIVCHKI